MKKLPIIQVVLAVSMLGAIAPAGWADSNAFTPELPPTTTDGFATPTEPVTPVAPVTLGTDTAIVVQFPLEVTLTIDEGQPYPVSLPLAQDILDAQGNVVVPAQSLVAMQLQPQEGGVKLVASSLVVNGQLVPIEGVGPIIPGTTVTYEDANASATDSSAVFSNLFANAAGLVTSGNPDSYTQGAMLGSVVGTIAGLQSAETARIVQIPQNATYVLSLTTPVTF